MKILVIFDHLEDDSYCLYTALYHCLAKNSNLKIKLKNLSNTFCVKETQWFLNLAKEFSGRIGQYEGVGQDNSTQIVCSFSHKTPIFFLNSISPKKIGIFNDKRIISNDYASPFLIMQNTPNKLNRENLYDLILNGTLFSDNISTKDITKSKKVKITNDNENLNQTIFSHKDVSLISKNVKNPCDVITNGKNLSIVNVNDCCFSTSKVGPINYLKKVGPSNLLEEIVHLSMIFSIFNIDYRLKDLDVPHDALNEFNQTIELSFEALNFSISYCKSQDKSKALEAVSLVNRILGKYRVFNPVAEYLQVLNATMHASDTDNNFLQQLSSNCQTVLLICQTMYHLSTQSKLKVFNDISQNN